MHSSFRTRRFLASLVLIATACTLPADGKERWRKRDRWQRVPELLEALGIEAGARVADIGAGRGYLTAHLAEAVGPRGRVLAVDIDEEALDELEDMVRDRGFSNVVPVIARPDDPTLPAASIDAAIMMRAYHEMDHHEAVLARVAAALVPGGRLVVVDQISDHLRDGTRAEQAAAHEIGIDFVRADLERAGYEIVDADADFADASSLGSDAMWMLVAQRR